MIVYHGSPNHNLKELKVNSYVSVFPHIAYIMGQYYTNTGKPWNDDDLKTPFRNGHKIYFKKGRKPDGIPALYKLEVEPEDIILHRNFPFEFQIKTAKLVKQIKNTIQVLDKSHQLIKFLFVIFDYYFKTFILS